MIKGRSRYGESLSVCRTIAIAALLWAPQPALAFTNKAVGQPAWLAAYDGPVNYTDFGTAISVDGMGNVYVTGCSYGALEKGFDYVTIKYDPRGNQVWAARYNGPGSGDDSPRDIVVDSSMNVYVTGYSLGKGSDLDYATVKYDAGGRQLWVARYAGPGDAVDMAMEMALDDDGNLYVTGQDGVKGYATIKYDADGKRIWIARYGGPDGTFEGMATGIALDSSGNIYVTGASHKDYATVKYDARGEQVWAVRYDNLGGDDTAKDIAVDGNGNAYVTGWSFGESDYDYVTLKYDAVGELIWSQRYDGPAHAKDRAWALVLDAQGDVYVTGGSSSATSVDYTTIKYSSSGARLWTARYDGTGHFWDVAYAVSVDGDGSVFVTGESVGAAGDPDYVTIAYDKSGRRHWVARHKGTRGENDLALAIACDRGKVYVTGGAAVGVDNTDVVTICYFAKVGTERVVSTRP